MLKILNDSDYVSHIRSNHVGLTYVKIGTQEVKKPSNLNHFHQMPCDDFTRERAQLHPEAVTEHGVVLPTRKMVKDVLTFVEGAPIDSIIVSCEMGISRSPAMAWGILLKYYGGSHAQATDEILSHSRHFHPNVDILQYAFEEVVGDPELFPVALKYLKAGIDEKFNQLHNRILNRLGA